MKPRRDLEPVDALHQTEIPLLDQVDQREPLSDVASRNGHDQPQVRDRQLPLRGADGLLVLQHLREAPFELPEREADPLLERAEPRASRFGRRLTRRHARRLHQHAKLARQGVDDVRLDVLGEEQCLEIRFRPQRAALGAGPRRGGEPAVARLRPEHFHLARQAPDARERPQHGQGLVHARLSALREDDEVLERQLGALDAGCQLDKAFDRKRNRRQGAELVPPRRLDPPANVRLLVTLQQRHLSDLVQVDTDRLDVSHARRLRATPLLFALGLANRWPAPRRALSRILEVVARGRIAVSRKRRRHRRPSPRAIARGSTHGRLEQPPNLALERNGHVRPAAVGLPLNAHLASIDRRLDRRRRVTAR